MKKKMHSPWMILLVLMASLPLFAQQLDEKASSSQTKPETSGNTHKMNVFKVNITSLPIRNYGFQYERILKQKISIAVGIRFMPTGNLPFKETLKRSANGDVEIEKAIENAQIGNFSITPEFRFYPGKKGYGQGFYLAPYYRYAKFNADAIPIDYNAGTGSKTINLNGNLTTNAGGLMLGAQWFLGKSITLDLWILGAHYGTGNGTFIGVPSSPFTTLEQNDIRQTIEDIELPVGTLKAEVTSNSAKAIFDGPWAGLRGGINIGIRF
jgi:hypothetical protein